MTNRQAKTIEKIKRMASEFMYSKNYEIKNFEIDEYEFFVSVVLETGMKNDEGTMASILARDKVHLFIYKGGAIYYPVINKKGQHVTRYLKSNESLLTVSIAQQ